MTKAYSRFLTAFFCLFLGGLLVWHIVLPDRERSETENRVLAQLPEFSWETLKDGKTPHTLVHGLNVLTDVAVDGGYVFMQPGEAHSYLLAVHMPKESTNVYQGKLCTVDVSVFAVQGNADI